MSRPSRTNASLRRERARAGPAPDIHSSTAGPCVKRITSVVRSARRDPMLAWRLQPASFRTSTAKVLFLFLLPTLLLVGHWSLGMEVGIPVTERMAPHDHRQGSSSEESGHEDEQHCHASAAMCTGAGAVPTASVAHLAEGLATLGAESPWRKISAETRDLMGWTSVPASPPPRPSQPV